MSREYSSVGQETVKVQYSMRDEEWQQKSQFENGLPPNLSGLTIGQETFQDT